MVCGVGVEQLEHAAHGAGLRIIGTVHDVCDARVDDRAGEVGELRELLVYEPT